MGKFPFRRTKTEARPAVLLEEALHRIFERGGDTPASWFALTGGEPLLRAGDEADTLYLLRSGRLGVFRPADGGEFEFIGVIRPGQPTGEMAMLAGTPHTADVIALRDSEVLALPREAFFEAARSEPDLMIELARLMIQRARDVSSAAGEPSVFGFISARTQPIRPFVEAVAAGIEAQNFTCQVIDDTALTSATEWFSRVEDSHDYVLYVAEADQPAWSALCARQVDRLFVVGDCRAAPPQLPLPNVGVIDHGQRTDLLMLRPASMKNPQGTSGWIDAVQAGRWFQATEGSRADAQRMARVITGCAVGVVFSGGGARAYAHIGALRALRTAGVPIDFIGGSSMGAVAAAGPAMGWSQEELEDRIRRSFVDSDPLADITFPLIAMTRARKVAGLIQDAYGDTELADLHLPYFAVSTNLTSGRIEVHRRGLMRRAMRATIAIPGVMPPVVIDGQVLVDGAVLKNFPADVMRQLNHGPIVGVDVSRTRGVDPTLIEHPPSLGQLAMSGAWRAGPPIVSILMRSATLTSDAELEISRKATDVLVLPTPDGIDIRDWKAYDAATLAGETATLAALAALPCPVTDLRRKGRPVGGDPASSDEGMPISEPNSDGPAETAAEMAEASALPALADRPV